MILITGGLGFIGLNAASALLAQGETCVLPQHRLTRIPEILKEEIGSRLFIEQLDVTDADAFLKLGENYPITGIIHLAARWTRTPGSRVLELFEDIQVNMIGLVNALQAAQRGRSNASWWRAHLACMAMRELCPGARINHSR